MSLCYFFKKNNKNNIKIYNYYLFLHGYSFTVKNKICVRDFALRLKLYINLNSEYSHIKSIYPKIMI